MARLKSIYRYPVKGLSGDSLEQTFLEQGKPIAFDRVYALALADTTFNAAQPQFLNKRKFLMLMRDEKLAALKTSFVETGHTLTILQNNQKILCVSLINSAGVEVLEEFFNDYMGDKVKGRPKLVAAPGHMFADVSRQDLSLINIDSIRELERKTKLKIDENRFRGNLIVEGLGAWKEFEFIGKDFKVGNIIFTATKRIERCAAINVNLKTAERDMNIPLQIRKNYGHIDCGISVDVKSGGVLTVGDEVRLASS